MQACGTLRTGHVRVDVGGLLHERDGLGHGLHLGAASDSSCIHKTYTHGVSRNVVSDFTARSTFRHELSAPRVDSFPSYEAIMAGAVSLCQGRPPHPPQTEPRFTDTTPCFPGRTGPPAHPNDKHRTHAPTSISRNSPRVVARMGMDAGAKAAATAAPARSTNERSIFRCVKTDASGIPVENMSQIFCFVLSKMYHKKSRQAGKDRLFIEPTSPIFRDVSGACFGPMLH